MDTEITAIINSCRDVCLQIVDPCNLKVSSDADVVIPYEYTGGSPLAQVTSGNPQIWQR